MMNDNEQEIRAHIEKIAYPTFEQRVREWIAAGKLGAPYTVLEQIFLMAKAGGEGVVPVRNNLDQNGELSGFTIKTVRAGHDGAHYVPVFTRSVYAEKAGSRTNVIAYPLQKLMQIAGSDPQCAGLVFDPWTYDFVVPADACRFFLEEAQKQQA